MEVSILETSFSHRLSFFMGSFLQSNLFHMRENSPECLLYNTGSLMWVIVHTISSYMIPMQVGVVQMKMALVEQSSALIKNLVMRLEFFVLSRLLYSIASGSGFQ